MQDSYATSSSPYRAFDPRDDVNADEAVRSREGSQEDEEKVDADEPTSYQPVPNFSLRHWLCFAVMGLLNNFAYTVIIASASALASSFSALSFIGLIQYASVILAIVIKLINGVFLLHISPLRRLLVSCLCCMIGLWILSACVSQHVSFWLALVSICLVGGYGAMCESVVVSYLSHFHPKVVGGWGTGSGGSGVAGTLFFLLVHGVWQLELGLIYLIVSPLCLLYMASFYYIQSTVNNEKLAAALTAASTTLDVDDSVLVPLPLLSRWAKVLSVSHHVKSMAIQLALVFFFEYLILVGLASQANPDADGSGWAYRNAYAILAFCYQLGVLVSRSSLPIIQVPQPQLFWMTLLQAINMLVWLVQAYRGLMPLALQFVHMFFVGTLAGGMYVNVMYLLRKDRVLRSKGFTELAINLITAMYNVGIVGASIVETILLQTVLTRQS